MMVIVVNLVGLLFIALVLWWFLFSKSKAVMAEKETIDVVVENGVYTPSVIKAKQGQTLHLQFLRKDETPCAEIVVFEYFKISQQLPLHQVQEVVLELKESGEFEFTCQMGMYRGKLVVE